MLRSGVVDDGPVREGDVVSRAVPLALASFMALGCGATPADIPGEEIRIPCNTTTKDPNGTMTTWAVHAFPGWSAEDIVRHVYALDECTDMPGPMISGQAYETIVCSGKDGYVVADGSIAVQCRPAQIVTTIYVSR